MPSEKFQSFFLLKSFCQINGFTHSPWGHWHCQTNKRWRKFVPKILEKKVLFFLLLLFFITRKKVTWNKTAGKKDWASVWLLTWSKYRNVGPCQSLEGSHISFLKWLFMCKSLCYTDILFSWLADNFIQQKYKHCGTPACFPDCQRGPKVFLYIWRAFFFLYSVRKNVGNLWEFNCLTLV